MAQEFNLDQVLQGQAGLFQDPLQQRYANTNAVYSRANAIVNDFVLNKDLPNWINNYSKQTGQRPTANQIAKAQAMFVEQRKPMALQVLSQKATAQGAKLISPETYQLNTQPKTQNPVANALSALKTGVLGVNPTAQQQLGGDATANFWAGALGSALRGAGVSFPAGALGQLVGGPGGAITASSLASGGDSAFQNIQAQKQAVYQGKQPNIDPNSAIAQGTFDALPFQHLKPFKNLSVPQEILAEGGQEALSQIAGNVTNRYNDNPLEGTGESFAGGAGVGLGMAFAKAVMGRFGRNIRTPENYTPEQETAILGTAVEQLAQLGASPESEVIYNELRQRYGDDIATMAVNQASSMYNATHGVQPQFQEGQEMGNALVDPKTGIYQGNVTALQEAPTETATPTLPQGEAPSTALNALASIPNTMDSIATALQPTQATLLEPQSVTVPQGDPSTSIPPVIGDVSQQQTQEVPQLPQTVDPQQQLIQQLQALPMQEQQAILSQLLQLSQGQTPQNQQTAELPQIPPTSTLPPQQTETLQGQQIAPNPEPQTPPARLNVPQVQRPKDGTTQGFKGAIQQTFGLNDEQADAVAQVYEATNRTMAERNAITPQEQAQRFEFTKATPEQLQGKELKQEQSNSNKQAFNIGDKTNVGNIEDVFKNQVKTEKGWFHKSLVEKLDESNLALKTARNDEIQYKASPTLVTAFIDGKKVGQLQTTAKSLNPDFKDYVAIGKVEVDKKHQGKGIATNLYKELLNALPSNKKGIIGYAPDIVAKKAIPRIYQKLGGSYSKEHDLFIVKKQNATESTFDPNNPDIRFQQALSEPLGAFQQKDQQLIIYGLTNPNVSTPLHELAHAYESVLNPIERKIVLQYAGQKKWNRATSEAFAEGFEAYLAEGNAPTKGLKSVFKKFKTWLTNIYKAIEGSPLERELSPAMREIYDVMLGGKPKDKAKTAKVYDNDGNAYEVRYKVVEASQLVTSNNDDLTPNKAYPQELQPRDRERATSREQINDIAQALTPEKLTDSKSITDGSPIVGKDNVVESGNGRTLAIRQAYKLFKDKGKEYKAYLEANASEFGLDPEVIKGMKQPVLVRERLTDTDRVAFTKKANESTIASLSILEQAKNDADKVSVETLNLLQPDEKGRLNGEFVQAFTLEVVPNNEHATMVNKQSQLTATGLKRIQNALLVKAFPNANNLTTLLDNAEEESVNLGKAMFAISPTVAEYKAQQEAKVYKDFDISSDIGMAVEKLLELKEKGITVKDYRRQLSLLGDGLSPEANKVLDLIVEYANKPKQLTNLLKHYYQLAKQEGNPEQMSILPDRSKLELLEDAEVFALTDQLAGMSKTDILKLKEKLSDAQFQQIERMVNCG